MNVPKKLGRDVACFERSSLRNNVLSDLMMALYFDLHLTASSNVWLKNTSKNESFMFTCSSVG